MTAGTLRLSSTSTCDASRLVAAAPPFARVSVYDDASAVAEAWAELEAGAPCSIYQTRAFVLPWLDTMSRKAGLSPRFVLARDGDDRPSALLCIGLTRRGPFRIATWVGGKDANFNLPLLRRPSAWTRADVLRLLKAAAAGCGATAPDAFEFANQPLAWAGVDNPFAQLPRSDSPSAAYGTDLPQSADAFFAAKLSKDTRKKLRKKEAKLAAMGTLTHVIVSDAGAQSRVVDTFLAQKTSRFRDRGIASDFDAPEMRAFIEAASAPHGTGIELHALQAGDRLVAIYGGAAHAGQWSGMFNSFDADEEIARSSPGDLLLMRIIGRCCATGIHRFDLGVGQARYKASLCDEPIPLFDSFVPVSRRGWCYLLVARLRQTAKRRIKQDARLLALANRLRGRVA